MSTLLNAEEHAQSIVINSAFYLTKLKIGVIKNEKNWQSEILFEGC